MESGQDTDFQGGFNADGDTNGAQDESTDRHDGDDLDDSDSGFGLDGKEACWTPKKFWNFVDYMLRQLCASVWKNAAPTDDVDKLIGEYVSPLVSTPPTCDLLLLIFHRRTFVHILQEDLLECPGSRRGMKLLSNINPEWQTAIQQKLM